MTIVHLPTVNDLPFTRATLSWIDDAIETKNFLIKRIEVIGNIALTLVATALEAVTHAAAFAVKCVILPASIWLAPENEKLSPLAELRDHVIRTLSSLTFLPLATVSIPFTLIAPSCIVKVYGLLGLKQNYGEISEPEEVEQQEITPPHAEPETLKAETSTIPSAGTPAEWSASSLFSSAGKVLTVGTQLATLGYIAYSRANPVEIHQHSSFLNFQMIVNGVATAAFFTISALHCKITASIIEHSKSTTNELNNFNRSLLDLKKLLTTGEGDASRPTLELVQEWLGKIEPELAKLESNSQKLNLFNTTVSGLSEQLGQMAEEIKKRPTREEGNKLFSAIMQASNVDVEADDDEYEDCLDYTPLLKSIEKKLSNLEEQVASVLRNEAYARLPSSENLWIPTVGDPSSLLPSPNQPWLYSNDASYESVHTPPRNFDGDRPLTGYTTPLPQSPAQMSTYVEPQPATRKIAGSDSSTPGRFAGNLTTHWDPSKAQLNLAHTPAPNKGQGKPAAKSKPKPLPPRPIDFESQQPEVPPQAQQQDGKKPRVNRQGAPTKQPAAQKGNRSIQDRTTAEKLANRKSRDQKYVEKAKTEEQKKAEVLAAQQRAKEQAAKKDQDGEKGDN